jgi:hypothetical protein
MDVRDWYLGQLVTEGEMDGAFAAVEESIKRGWSDAGMSGVISGFTVSQHTPNNLKVNVVGGLAVTPLGERVYLPNASTITVDCEFDNNGDPTAVTTIGNSRVLSVIAFFDRALSDPRTDALSQTVYFQRNEYLSIEIIQGAEAGSPSAPAVPAGGVRLANIQLTYGQTAITTGSIDTVTARQWMFDLGPAGPIMVNEGTVTDAMNAIMDGLNQHVSGAAYPHDAAAVAYDGSGFWADGSTKVTSADVGGALDEVVSDLASLTTGDSGYQRIGCAQDTSSPGTLSAESLKDRLTNLRQAANLSYAGSGNWADATAIAATSIEGALDTIVSTLAATSGSGGAIKVGIGARTAWLGGRTNAATHVYAAIDKIITDLAAATTSDDGAERIGAEAGAGYTQGSVRSQLDQIGPSATTTYTGAKTFDNITASGTNKYNVALRTITREQDMLFKRSTGSDRVKLHEYVDVAYTESAVQSLNRIPHGATVSQVTFYHDRVDTGSLPFTRVQGSVWKTDLTSGVTTQVGTTVTDPVATLGAYNVYHSFAVTGLSEVIDRTKYSYYAKLDGETTPNDSTTNWYGSTVTFTVTACEEAQ